MFCFFDCVPGFVFVFSSGRQFKLYQDDIFLMPQRCGEEILILGC